MSPVGIPPSPDRIAFHRQAAVTVGVCLVLAGLAAWLVLAPRGERPGVTYAPPSDSPSSSSDEVGYAEQAARQYVLNELNPMLTRRVAWSVGHHEGHLGWYRFDGRLEVEDPDNRVHKVYYVATVQLEGGQWALQDISVEETGVTEPAPSRE